MDDRKNVHQQTTNVGCTSQLKMESMKHFFVILILLNNINIIFGFFSTFHYLKRLECGNKKLTFKEPENVDNNLLTK